MFKSSIFLIFLLFVLSPDCTGQRFKAMAIIGANASQIDGDNLYGFNKLGVSAGGRLSYANDKNIDYALEMLYSQRGSSVKIFNNEDGNKISLNYIEIPIIVSIRDWYNEKDGYYKVRAEGGISYGYLFGANASGFQEEYFRKHDVCWLAAVGINFNKMLGLSLRYTASFSNMYKDPTADRSTLKGYFITLRSEINF
ncbi:MAG: porin family protein [Saprospiraceae bacterium]